MFELKDFPSRLSQLRMNKQVSAREMSLAIGMNPGYIQNIEIGKNFPSMENFLYICEYLEIMPGAFFDIDAKDPGKLQAVMEDLRKLDEEQLDSIHTLIKGLAKK